MNELPRFLAVGCSNALVSYLVFLLGYHVLFGGNVLLAQPLSYGAGIAWSYFWNRRWTFRSSAGIGAEAARFVTVQLALLLLSTLLMHLAIDQAQLNPSLGWLLVISVITVLNFILVKTLVFNVR